MSRIPISAPKVSLASAPTFCILISKPSCGKIPLDLIQPANLSTPLLKVPLTALLSPPEFLILPINFPAAPNAPVKAAPSIPNFNLFNNSACGSPSFSISNSVGPPKKFPKVPASSTSPTNTPSAAPAPKDP